MISELNGDRVGMIVFAGTAHLHFPLTSDYAAAKLFLNSVDTRLVQFQGTVIGDALRLAIDSFDPESEEHKTVILISDGEDHDGRALALAKEAAETGIIINAVGVGSHAGAPIPIKGGSEFKKDKSGRVITTTLNERALEEIATAGSGTYSRVDNRVANLSGLMEEIQAMRKRTLRSQEFSQYEDRFQWFLIPALLLLLIEFLLPEGRRDNPQARRRFEI
jgi:Ca-activated chloride channel family protein